MPITTLGVYPFFKGPKDTRIMLESWTITTPFEVKHIAHDKFSSKFYHEYDIGLIVPYHDIKYGFNLTPRSHKRDICLISLDHGLDLVFPDHNKIPSTPLLPIWEILLDDIIGTIPNKTPFFNNIPPANWLSNWEPKP